MLTWRIHSALRQLQPVALPDMTAQQSRPGGQYLAEERGSHELDALVLAPVPLAVAPLQEFAWGGSRDPRLHSFLHFYDSLPRQRGCDG